MRLVGGDDDDSFLLVGKVRIVGMPLFRKEMIVLFDWYTYAQQNMAICGWFFHWQSQKENLYLDSKYF